MGRPNKFFLALISICLICAPLLLADICDGSELGRTLYTKGEQRSAESYGVLVSYLTHHDPHIRRIAAHALGKLGNRGAVPHLKILSTDNKQLEIVRRVALRSMARLDDPLAKLIVQRRSEKNQVMLRLEAPASK